MLSEDDRRKRRRIWLLGTAAWVALAAVAVAWAVRHIPEDISARTVSALQAAGLDPRADARVEGRTVILSGEVPNAYTRARMRAIAGSIRGVREVSDRLTVAPLLAKPLQSAEPASRPPAPEPPAPADQLAPPAAAGPVPPETPSEAVPVSPSDPPPAAAAAAPQPAMPAPPPPMENPSTPPESPAPRSDPEPLPPPAGLQLPRLYFAFGSTRLTPESEPRLHEIVEALRLRPEVRIEVAGHADATGPRSFNQRLSLQRARTVADRLVAAGIDDARLQANGYCDSRPLTDNHTRKGQAMNRRVELILIP